MKKLKKKIITKYLQRVHIPTNMSLKEYATFYNKLISKYGDSKDFRLIYRDSYYSGAYWLMERRLETDAEFKLRKKKYDEMLARIEKRRVKKLALQKAETARRQAQAKAMKIKMRAEMKKQKEAKKKADMEKKLEDIKTMVKVLKLSGFEVSSTKSSARN